VPTRLIDALKASNEVTIEAWIKQEDVEQSGPARIVTLSSDNSQRAVTLAHDGNMASYNYVSRLQTTDGDGNGAPELSTSLDFTSLSLHHVVYTRDSEGTEKMYVNGLKLADSKRYGDFSSWNDDYRLALANEVSGERPWKGVFYMVAIFNKAFSKEKVDKNFTQGFGQIRFANHLDTLTSNVAYKITPFVATNQGIVYGTARDFMYQNVALTDSLLSFYPNPNGGTFRVKVKNRDETVKIASLRIADFAGQVHYNTELDLSEGLLEKDFEIQLPPYMRSGFYTLMLISGDNAVAEKLVLIR
ncbi:MAG: T9SS type A sorting domain-containing protein, partial [Bacteroidales bacterium]|nr:T9SS type A sorting domain-containing protein [Bacteroidales bacterium]